MKVKNIVQNSKALNVVYSLTALLFLFSAYTKLISLTSFEITLYAYGIPLKFTELIARLLLICEITIGILLLVGLFNQNIISLYFAFIVLSLFDVLLIRDLFSFGGDKDCGCFGDIIAMSSQAALIKNILFQLVLFPFLRYGLFKGHRSMLITVIIFVFISVSVMLVFPIKNIFSQDENKISAVLFTETALDEVEQPTKSQLFVEDQFLIFMHYNCDHCRAFTKHLNRLFKEELLPQVVIVLYGTEEKIAPYITETDNKIPIIIIDRELHLKTCRGQFPSVFMFKGDSLYGSWNQYDFDYHKIQAEFADKKDK